ncbi:MFS transporter [Lactobacillus crispatus]|uniref:MFS transporter n=1 Tax=Lactobacillus crispatus TaxID=47770 RepID=UPI001E3DF9D0|nr:MFS transporter [Lactobacillus crispatus]
MEASSKLYLDKTRIGVLAVSAMGMAALAITPSYAAMAKYFQLSNTGVQMLTSFPNLFMMFAGLLMGRLTATQINIKTLTLVMIALTAVGGLLPLAFHSNFVFLVICSCLVGLGQGACTNLSQVLIARMLPGALQQSTMGLTTTFTNLGGIIFIMGGGQLATNSTWVQNYWIYLFAILVFIVAICLIPMKPLPVDNATKEDHAPNEKIKLNKYVFYSAFWAFCALLLNNILNNNIALYIAEQKLGSTSQAALASTISLIGGMLCGFAVGQIGKKFRTSSIALAFFLYAISYFIIGFGGSLITSFIGSFLTGAAMSIAMGQFAYLISSIVNKKSVSMALGVYQAINPIGGVVSPFVVNPLSNALHFNVFIIGGFIALVLAVILLVGRYQRNLVHHQALS